MPNDSSTGGYLVPEETPVVLEDEALINFLHDVFVGVVALAGNLVRPSWQRNPPPIPEPTVNWLAFGITEQRGDDSSWQAVNGDEEFEMQRHEEVDVLCIFYGPLCQTNANRMRDGFELAQNREQLLLADMGVVRVSPTVHAPQLISEQYFDRADSTVTMRREIRRSYPVLHFLAAQGTTVGNRESITHTDAWSVVE